MNTPSNPPSQPAKAVFISHASADDVFVAKLRERLEAHRHPVWVDSRNLRGGDALAPEIVEAIEHAPHTLVVLSTHTVNSSWVRREVKHALTVAQRRQADDYRVIPLLLPGIEPSALEFWFDQEPVGVRIQLGPGGLDAALPDILAALRDGLPTDAQPALQPAAKPVEELVLRLTDPRLDTQDGKRRVAATATLIYEPAQASTRRGVTSLRFAFTAPLGPIERDDLRWYLEEYYRWPVGVFASRAQGIEAQLPEWGKALFKATLGVEPAAEALNAWRQAGDTAERRFSVEVDADPIAGASEEAQKAAQEAATDLLSLPWELLHDDQAWLFQGKAPARVRRRLPERKGTEQLPTSLPVRILLVSPRPDRDAKGNPIGYIDHRVSARPLIEAVEGLGELVRLTLLTPPTFGALDRALQDAADRHEPFDVVHFDGHGVYDRRLGLGGLCFEDAQDAQKLNHRTMEFIDAGRLAGLFTRHRVPLVFLEACETAMTEKDPTASVAASLLERGVASVAAMSHSVLVETARRFVAEFYREAARGARVGRAMLAGQRALFADASRGKVLGAGELRLQDWFVPVLYQEKHDPQLITRIPAEKVQRLEAARRRLNLGRLPEEPEHRFQGRSRELLALERLLADAPWAVVRGTGGAGKTTLAAEMARWLVRTGRFARAAFVSLETHTEPHPFLIELGRQLLPEGEKFYFAPTADPEPALQQIERALIDHPTVLLIDNCESILAMKPGVSVASPGSADAAVGASAGDSTPPILLTLCERLLRASPRTRLVFTSRESLPEPFDHPGRERELGALDRPDAIELVAEVMKQNGWMPPAADPGGNPREIVDLVDAVQCHARALVLLAREVAQRGVRTATADLRGIMAALERKRPGDRENSLYASVELSLRRLPSESRERLPVLGVCHGGIHLWVLGQLTGLEPEAARQLAIQLIGVGLGEDMGCGHLRLDPGLPPYLLGELPPDKVAATRARWAEAMVQLTGYLYQEQFKNAQVAASLTLLELPNLMAMLEWAVSVALAEKPRGSGQQPGIGPESPAASAWTAERVVDLAESVERLVSHLGRPQALALATRLREQAAQRLGEWSHARFVSESAAIERLIERGEFAAALPLARNALERCRNAGDAAYPEAAYDGAMAEIRLGRVLLEGGAAEEALAPIQRAQERFQRLAEAGNATAEQMASAAITEVGDCLAALGRLDEAAQAYQQAMQMAETAKLARQVAVGKFQLGSVRMLQKRYSEALQIYAAARDTFAQLGEPRQVATVWHQIGMVHQEAGQLETAEQAYRESLAIKVREQDLGGQAASLIQLGNLYDAMDRLEEAVKFYRQCAELYVRLQNLANEGLARNNLADTLIKLKRYDEARQELRRTIECKKPFGHAPQPWTTWAILENLERATGHPQAALAARQNAIQAYLAYRRAGGVSQHGFGQLFEMVGQALQQDAPAEALTLLAQLAAHPEAPPPLKALVGKLQSVLAGERNPALAAKADLEWGDAAELQLLLESLTPPAPGAEETEV